MFIAGHDVKTGKKLIEVALPLDAINAASVREKSIRHGHPSTLHLWWARRPLAAARAVIFSQMVDDPSAHPDRFPTEQSQARERERLFEIIEQLVQWENTNNAEVEDVRYYGRWMRDEAEKRIGHLYPKVEVTTAMAEEETIVVPLASPIRGEASSAG